MLHSHFAGMTEKYRKRGHEVMKEINQDTAVRNEVKNLINNVSGAYAIPLFNKLFSDKRKGDGMRDIYSVLAILIEANRITEAMQLIRGLFAIAGMEYPYLILMLEEHKEEQNFFISEFMEDFYEFMDDCRLETE